MIILGIYCGHDSNFCLVEDGRLLAHFESERTSRRHHEGGMHKGALDAMLRFCGVTYDRIDLVAIGGTTVSASIDPLPEPITVPEEARLGPFTDDPVTRVVQGSTRLAGRTVPVVMTDHHLSHAALAYYTSPYPRAKIVSWDGGGDGAFGMMATGVDGRITRTLYNPPSGLCNMAIGGAWTDIGKLFSDLGVGQKVDYEGKIMGHASYGQPRTEIKQACRAYIEQWNDLFSRGGRQEALSRLARMANLTSFLDQSCKDFSASLQAATEEIMQDLLSAHATPDEAVVIGGGCAYNCVANGRLFSRWPKMFVSNVPHDGGLSIGAALFTWHHLQGHPFLGMPEFDPYCGIGTSKAPIGVADRVVGDLLAGKIVAWFDGRSESGKRALGNRSILLDPRIPDGKDILNQRVKHREWFRPYAPSVLAGHDGWCEGPVPPSPFMGFSCKVAPGWQERIPSVVHVDGTCRPQIVTPTINPVYHRIIDLFHQATGVPMILNTSFNVQEPIVDLPEHAHRTFARGGIDVLYVHGERFTR